MRRVAPRLAWIIAASLMVEMASAADWTADEGNTKLISIAKTERFVFASIPTGLFRASLDTKQWERLKTPPDMPFTGHFASQPGPSPVILFVAQPPARRPTDPPVDRTSRHGLYLSRDDGQTWELASARDDYWSVLLHPDGSIYAASGTNFFPGDGWRLERSPDLGKTWRDIAGTTPGPIQDIAPDPDRPSLVRIVCGVVHPVTYAADDDRYRWKLKASMHSSESNDFSAPSYRRYGATLANYFGHDFETATSVPALELIPVGSRFEFAPGHRVVIPVRIVFHHDPDIIWTEVARPATTPRRVVVRFADRPGAIDFWGCRVETAGAPTLRLPTSRGTGTAGDHPPAPEFRVFDLTPSSPYQREVDLTDRFDFTKLGEYRVQVVYSSGGWTRDDNAIWAGRLSSRFFTVVVRD